MKAFAITVLATVVGSIAVAYLTNNVGPVRRFVNGL